MSWGIKVSQPGVDVGTATPKDLMFSSQYNSFKVVNPVAGTFTKTGAGAEAFTFAHGLSYIPAYELFLKVSSRWYGAIGDDTTSGLQWISWVDATNFNIYAINGDTASFVVKAYPFIDEATNAIASSSSTGNFGMKISNPSFDVGTATDQQLNFTTKYQTFKIVNTETFTYTAETGEKTEAHGLGYTPAWVAIVKANTAFELGDTVPAPYLLVGNREIHVWSDATNVGVRVESLASEDLTVKVAVLSNQLE